MASQVVRMRSHNTLTYNLSDGEPYEPFVDVLEVVDHGGSP